MKVQYVIYKTELDDKGEEVEIYMTPSGGASANHEEALLLTSQQIREGEVGPDDFPYIRLDPAVSEEAYFGEYYNLFVEKPSITILAMAEQGLIPMKAALAMGLSEEMQIIFFTTIREMLITYIKTPGVTISWKDTPESIPLTAFKGELVKILQITNIVAISVSTELSAMRKRNAARKEAESK